MESKLRAIRDGGSGEEVNIKTTKQGSALTAQFLPSGAVPTAKGESWQIMTTSAVASLVVRPGTIAHLTLYNGEAAGGKSYIIERVYAHALVTAAVKEFFHLWICVHRVGTAAVTSSITAFASNRGIANYGGNAIAEVDLDPVVDDGWFPWGPTCEVEVTGVLPGSIVCAEIGGRLIVPPTSAISIAPVCSTIAVTCVVGLQWYEETIDLG